MELNLDFWGADLRYRDPAYGTAPLHFCRLEVPHPCLRYRESASSKFLNFLTSEVRYRNPASGTTPLHFCKGEVPQPCWGTASLRQIVVPILSLVLSLSLSLIGWFVDPCCWGGKLCVLWFGGLELKLGVGEILDKFMTHLKVNTLFVYLTLFWSPIKFEFVQPIELIWWTNLR